MMRGGPGLRDVRWLLGISALVLVAWSFLNPVFEGPDEVWHWQYARHLHNTWSLPIYDSTFPEGNSPPLYYAAIAPVAARTATPPVVNWGDGRDDLAAPLLPRLHLTAGDDFDRYWPIRYARLLSALMSVITVALCAAAGFTATRRWSTALLAAGLAIFLPQFSYRGGQVSNDALVTAMAAWQTWLMVLIVRDGFTWRRGLLAGVALAAAYLSKINAIGLAPPLALVLLTDPVPWRTRLIRTAAVLGLVLAIAAPWSLRNVMLYGDPFASHAMYEAVSGLISERPLWNLHFVTVLPRESFKTFVGFFGHYTIKLPKWLYGVYLLFVLFALGGLVPRLRRDRRDLRLVLVLLATALSAYAVLVRINLQFDQPQGRYLFPALPAIMLLLALGLEGYRWWASPDRLWPARATLAGYGAVNLLILGIMVVPAYYPPVLPTISETVTFVRTQPQDDLAPAPVQPDGGGLWIITGPQPSLAADVRTHTSDALWATVEFQVRAPVKELTGAFVFTLDSGTRVRKPFVYRADGKRRTIIVMMLKDPAWTGRVTRVQLEPIEDAPASVRGAEVLMQQIRLRGSLPSFDF